MKNLAIIFDMDGVIVDSNPFHKLALKQFCSSKGKILDEEAMITKIYGRANKDWLRNLFGQEISDQEIMALGNEKEAIFRNLYKNDIKPVEGLKEFLDLLETENIPFAIGTSAPRANVDFTLEKTGLSSYFKIILDETNVKIGKPHPEIYINCAKALDKSTSNCIVFEDSMAGIESAKSARCKVVGITTTHSVNELSQTDMIINNFKQLDIQKLYNMI